MSNVGFRSTQVICRLLISIWNISPIGKQLLENILHNRGIRIERKKLRWISSILKSIWLIFFKGYVKHVYSFERIENIKNFVDHFRINSFISLHLVQFLLYLIRQQSARLTRVLDQHWRNLSRLLFIEVLLNMVVVSVDSLEDFLTDLEAVKAGKAKSDMSHFLQQDLHN